VSAISAIQYAWLKHTHSDKHCRRRPTRNTRKEFRRAFNRNFVSVHRALHLLCCRALEGQKTSARPTPCICGTLQTVTIRWFEAHRTLQPCERLLNFYLLGCPSMANTGWSVKPTPIHYPALVLFSGNERERKKGGATDRFRQAFYRLKMTVLARPERGTCVVTRRRPIIQSKTFVSVSIVRRHSLRFTSIESQRPTA
jgi:hypothetical protein